MIKIESGKKYLITGGAGFLGGELIERILQQGGDVVTVSRNEGKLIELKSKYLFTLIYCWLEKILLKK